MLIRGEMAKKINPYLFDGRATITIVTNMQKNAIDMAAAM